MIPPNEEKMATKTIEILRAFMAVTKGEESSSCAMAASAMLIMLSHEEDHDQQFLLSWFANRVFGKDWHVFHRELVEKVFDDPRMPKRQ